MARQDSQEQMDTDADSPAGGTEETHSGTPNPTDPNSQRSTEHKSGYGGEGGDPRTSSDQRRKEKD